MSMRSIEVNILKGNEALYALKEHLLHVEILREVNRIPTAEITLWDGDFAKQDFPLSNRPDLEPGQELSISAEYLGASDNGSGGKTTPPIFNGLIIKQSIEASTKEEMEASQLRLELKSQAYSMTLRRRSRVFKDITDSQVCKTILEEYGLQIGEIEETETTFGELVQYNCTDWDFLLSRADFNGLWVVLGMDKDGNEIVDITRPEVAASPDHSLSLGLEQPPIYQIELEADLTNQVDTVESFSWNSNTQEKTIMLKARDFQLPQGNLEAATLAESINNKAAVLQSSTLVKEEALQTWADSFLVKSRLALIRGQISVLGSSQYDIGQTIEISGVGQRFNGSNLLSGIRQEVGLNGWITNLQLGQSPHWFVANQDVAAPAASSLMPPIHGLHIGKVEAYEKDQDRKLLVKVSIPGIHEKEGIVYARLGMPYAGQDHGLFFRPEKEDEVILGFFDNDPNHPVILGSLYNDQHLPPVEDNDLVPENNIKKWRTRQGVELTWDEQTPGFEILACQDGKKKTKLLLNKEKIEITDIHENSITMDTNGITIHSKKGVTINAPKVDIN
jgi:Rhs element Vgr protein